MALLTITSRTPSPSSRAAAIRRSMSSPRRTSDSTKRATPPASAMSWSVAVPPTCRGSRRTSPTTTRAPSAAKATQRARPIPDAPPVTMIVRSGSLGMQRTVEAWAARGADIPGWKLRSRRNLPMGGAWTRSARTLGGDDTLQSALASLPGLSVIVLDTRCISDALHGTALQRHGYVHERMIGQTLREVMPRGLWQRLEPLCAQALAGETVTFDQAALDGKAVYESTLRPVVRDGQVLGATMTSRDITAQRAAEEELAQVGGRLRRSPARTSARPASWTPPARSSRRRSPRLRSECSWAAPWTTAASRSSAATRPSQPCWDVSRRSSWAPVRRPCIPMTWARAGGCSTT